MDKIKKYKSVVWGLVIVLVTTMILVGYNYQADAALGSTPSITVQIDSTSPNPAKVGEDITITGTIIPQDFEMSQEKEIVLVLDTSTSMRNDIKEKSLECKEHRVKGYCVIHNKSTCNYEECTWEWEHDGIEKWYCTKHEGWCKEQYQKEKNKPVSSCDKNPHDVRNDYCKIHDRTGKHYTKTRIGELKNAAVEFVESLKKESNVSIAVVTYDQIAVINPKEDMTTSRGEKFYDISNEDEYNEVINMIESIALRDGTNMGEGLRKAAYMIQQKGSINSNKSIVFMTDGEPNYYSCTYDKKDFYTMIDNTSPDTDGNPAGGYVPEAKKYAVEIGKILNDYCNNVFSIGYGIKEKSDAEGYINEIHTSMGGSKDTLIISTGENITEIFNKIATDIKSTYTVSDILMNLNLSSEFTIDIEGNKINLDNIVYTTDGIVKKGKVLYKAEPTKFSFIIKGNSIGNFEVLDGSTITFPWKKNQISARVPSVEIDVQDNEKPNISAVLASEKEVTASIGQNIEVTYNITGEAFEYNNSGDINNKKDVLIILDTSRSTASYINGVKNALWNDVLNNNSLRNSDVKYGIITYNQDAEVLSIFDDDITKLNDNYIKNISCSNNNVRKLDEAMKKATEEMQKARNGADKYIVLIGGDHQTYNINDSDRNSINNMLSGLTKFITLSVPNSNNNLGELHVNEFKGSKDDYLLTSNDAQNDIQNKYMKEVANRVIGSGTRNNHKFNVSLNFNLNDNFVVAQSDIDSNRVQVSGNNLTINNIIVEYNYNANTSQYEMISQSPISFNISCKDGKTGILSFGPSNSIEYISIGNKAVSKNIAVPKVTVVSPVRDITHGIDLGIKDGQYIVREETLNMAAGVEATFASTAKIYSNNTDILLSIDKNIDVGNGNSGSTIKVYSCIDGVLSPLNIVVTNEEPTSGAYNYRIMINDLIYPDTMIVVRYSCKPPIDSSVSGEVYTNTIRYGSESKDASIKVEKDTGRMPDLF